MSGLRIEIVGNDELARRMLRQVQALEVFDIHSVPDPNPGDAWHGPGSERNTMLRMESVRGGRAILQENHMTGDIEGIPVVMLDAPKEISLDDPDPRGTLLRSPPASIGVTRKTKRPPARRWSRAPWSRRAAR